MTEDYNHRKTTWLELESEATIKNHKAGFEQALAMLKVLHKRTQDHNIEEAMHYIEKALADIEEALRRMSKEGEKYKRPVGLINLNSDIEEAKKGEVPFSWKDEKKHKVKV